MLDSFGVVCLLSGLWYWHIACKVYGYIPLNIAWQKARIGFTTKSFVPLSVSLVGIAAAVGMIYVPEWIPPIPYLLLCALPIFTLIYECRPSAVLLLGASSPQNTLFYKEIAREVKPMRLVHLLNVDFPGNLEDRTLWEAGQRTWARWKPIVDRLIHTVPSIMIDTRVPTVPVIQEARTILSSKALTRKTIFIQESLGTHLMANIIARERRSNSASSALESSADEELFRPNYVVIPKGAVRSLHMLKSRLLEPGEIRYS